MSFFSYNHMKNNQNVSHNYFKTLNLPKNEMLMLKDLQVQNKQDKLLNYPIQKAIKLVFFLETHTNVNGF